MNIEYKKELREGFLKEGFDSYVLFTMSGKEDDLADELNRNYEDLYCLILRRMVHRSDHGKKWDEEAVLIKGYVFVFAPTGYDIRYVKSENNPFRILKSKLDMGKLFGDDLEYAQWVLKQDGLIGISKAIRVNEKVKIIEGPLAEMEGNIIQYSRRNRNCLVELNFMNRTIRTWLPFEWTDVNYTMDKE